MLYLLRLTTIGLGALFVINIFRLLQGRAMKWHGFHYTRGRYYLLLFVWLAPIIIRQPPLAFWATFAAFGFLGILGESLFSCHWEQVFGKKIWVYKKDIILGGHSSWLNVIPWGIGGVLYLSLTSKWLYMPTASDLFIFWIIYLAIFFAIAGIKAIWTHLKKSKPSMVRSLIPGYVSFFLPLIGTIVITSVLLGHYHMIVAALLYSLGGCICEYFFGRMTAFILTDKLWIYLPDPIDNGHMTLWSLLPFMFAGFWFISIAHILR